MKKSTILLGGIASVVTIQLAGAGLIRSQVEEGVKRAVQAYGEQIAYPLEVSNFKSGWFSSSFSVQVPIPQNVMKLLKQTDLNVEVHDDINYLTFDTKISHGPVIWSDGLHFKAAYVKGIAEANLQQYVKEIQDVTPESPPILLPIVEQIEGILKTTYTVDVSYLGDVHLSSRIQGGEITFEDGSINPKVHQASIKIDPILYNWSIQGNARESHISLTTGLIETNFGTDDNVSINLALNPTYITADITPLAGQYWDGTFSIEQNGITFESQTKTLAKSKFSISAITAKGKSAKDSDSQHLMNISQAFTFKDMNIQSNTAVVSVGDITLNTSLQNILLDLMSFYIDTTIKSWKGSAQSLSFDLGKDTEITSQLIVLLNRQLSSAPQFNIHEYAIGNEAGEVRSEGYIQLTEPFELPENFFTDLETSPPDTQALMGHIEAELNYTLDPKYIKSIMTQETGLLPPNATEEQIDQVIANMLAVYETQGFLMKSGDIYEGTIKIQDSVVSVNGKPFHNLASSP